MAISLNGMGKQALALIVALGLSGAALADIPPELYDSLGVAPVDQGGDPAELYDALEWRYHDPAEGAGEGSLADFWDPIPFSKYTNPQSFYEPPEKGKGSDRQGCVECHEKDTAGHTMAWKASVHANLNAVRNLSPEDPRFYKREKLVEVERNLVALGYLDEGDTLSEVSCMDCHVELMREGQADHKRDLRMPDAAVCGACHLQEFAERESERDTLNWPQEQWPAGRPSHALDYHGMVELAMWAGMAEREVAEGCLECHSNQNKCDSCHTRHTFSAAAARKPEACATCHNGIAHNEFENYMMSKHGTIYQTSGDDWDWEVRLQDAYELGGQTAPTCASCHFEYKGQFGHNMVRKVRWGFTPMPEIADNLGDSWFEQRKEAWIANCSRCHSESFARAYQEMADNAIKAGLEVQQDAKRALEALHAEGLLVGQDSNRPAPPEPVEDGAGEPFQMFIASGNNPSAIEFEHASGCRNSLNQLYKGVMHTNPGGWAYSEGWSPLVGCYARIMDAGTRMREMDSIRSRLAAVEESTGLAMFDLDSDLERASVGSLGGALMLVGVTGLLLRRRKSDPDEA
jgi:hydroxylamine dehydrogenase